MKKIVFLIPSMTGGGAERVIANLSNEMVSRGLDVTILMTSGDKIEYALDDRVKVEQLGTETKGSITKIIKRIFDIRHYIRSNTSATFVAMETNTNIYTLVAAMGLKSQIIVSERNDPDKYNHKAIRNLLYYLLGRGFVFQTKDAMRIFSFTEKRNAVIIPNPIRNNLPEIAEGSRDKKIIAIGRLEPQKNYPLLIEAFASFSQINPDYYLHIYGKGYLNKELTKLSIELGLKDRIIWEGFQAEPWISADKGSIYILPSDYEGMPNALIEAMAMGMACISTDCPIGGPRDLITNGENGLLVPVGDVEALIKAMNTLATDEELRTRISHNATKIRDRLNISRITDMWMELL